MRIRIINDKDWEKSYELDKSIIRVGSQITCDIMISDPEVPALMMQITRSGTIDIRNTMRFFTENVTLTRGEQTFPPDLNMPYEVLDGDKITFSRYRMIIELESDKSRVRQSEHMRAEMFLSDRDLAPDSPISGGLLLKNLGKSCLSVTLHLLKTVELEGVNTYLTLSHSKDFCIINNLNVLLGNLGTDIITSVLKVGC